MFIHEKRQLDKIEDALLHLIRAQERQNALLHELVETLKPVQRATSEVRIKVA